MSQAQQTYHGATNIRFGLGSTAITVTGLIGIYQSIDQTYDAQLLEVTDQRGSTIAPITFNPVNDSTFDMVVSDNTTPNNGAAVIAVIYPGAMVTVGSDAADPVAGSTWIIMKLNFKEQNNDVVKANFTAKRWNLVTV